MNKFTTDTPFYFIRHGQSQANADGTPAGTIDTPLTDFGRQEAERLRPVVEKLAIKTVRDYHQHFAARDRNGGDHQPLPAPADGNGAVVG